MAAVPVSKLDQAGVVRAKVGVCARGQYRSPVRGTGPSIEMRLGDQGEVGPGQERVEAITNLACREPEPFQSFPRLAEDTGTASSGAIWPEGSCSRASRSRAAVTQVVSLPLNTEYMELP